MFEIDKNRILEIASISQAASQLMHQYYPEAFPKEYKDLSQVSTTGKAMYLPGGFGKRLLLQLNTSPLRDQTFKSLAIDKAFKAELIEDAAGQLLVFEDLA